MGGLKVAVILQNMPKAPWARLLPSPNAWQGSGLRASDYLLTKEASLGPPQVLDLFGIFPLSGEEVKRESVELGYD